MEEEERGRGSQRESATIKGDGLSVLHQVYNEKKVYNDIDYI